jgi:N-acylneuraminate cytidylyltransferase
MVNGAIYATRRDVFMNRGTFQGEKCLGYIMPPERSVNIDSEVDFVVAEYLVQS